MAGHSVVLLSIFAPVILLVVVVVALRLLQWSLLTSLRGFGGHRLIMMLLYEYTGWALREYVRPAATIGGQLYCHLRGIKGIDQGATRTHYGRNANDRPAGVLLRGQ